MKDYILQRVLGIAVLTGLLCVSRLFSAEESKTYQPTPITLNANTCGNGWREWEGIGDLKGYVGGRERLTALSSGSVGDIWVGTSRGRLLSMAKDMWTLQAEFKGVQITGIAFETADKLWLSTSDGIRGLSRNKEVWQLKEYRQYYQGQPAFVSGGYIPGEDSVRLWGFVDRIYIPPKNRTYAPFALSSEHGLFCYGGYHGVWHHFMPHYWGANSEWLDTRELLPHRRPTCIVEDVVTNLWIGTEGDGIVRLNARGRDYHKRDPENNKEDGTEFTTFGSKEIGHEFDRVVNLGAGRERGIWAVIGTRDHQNTLARFDGKAWTSLTLSKDSWKADCIAEIKPDVVLVGTEWDNKASLLEVDWQSRKVVEVPDLRHSIFEIITLPDGRLFAASWWALYERSPQN
jgi:hypothetical protein